MKRVVMLGLAALALVGTAGGIGYWYAMRQMSGMTVMTEPSTGSKTVATKSSQESDGRKVLYWHDPMVPGQKFDKPGKSPFMDMQLVPIYADAGGDEGKVSISPRVAQNLGVRTGEVVRGSLAQKVDAVGSIAYNERNVAVVQARAAGFIEKLYVRALFDPVKKGQPLVQILAPEWVAVQEEYLALMRMQVPDMEELQGAARQRLMLVGMTEAHIRSTERSGKVHARVTLNAPVSGVISELGAREGMTVMPGTTLFRINDLSSVWVNAEVPEAQAAAVKPGNPVRARTPAYPGTVFSGKVIAILPEVNPTTRTLKVRIELANPNEKLSPGMFASVDFAMADKQAMLMVPSEAVIQTGKRSVVLVAEGAGMFKPVDVEVGMESDGQTEIRSGLAVGQKVVVSSQFLIDSEASLKGTTTRMSGMPASDSGKATGQLHHGAGKVEAIDKDEITLSHGPIASLQWGPMTMGFKLSANSLPHNVAVGDEVAFEFSKTEVGTYQITAISPNPDAAAQGMKDKSIDRKKMDQAGVAK